MKRPGKRVPRVAHIPMMPATRARIAMAMHLSAEALVLAPSSTTATEAAKLLAIMTAAIDYLAGADDLRDSASWRSIELALKALESVEARHDAGKNWGVTGEEAKTLRAAAAQFDHVLRLIPYNVYQAAEIFVTQALDSPAEPDDRLHRLLGAVTQ